MGGFSEAMVCSFAVVLDRWGSDDQIAEIDPPPVHVSASSRGEVAGTDRGHQDKSGVSIFPG